MKEEASEPKSSRHPCFKLESPEALLQLRQRIWEHHQKGGAAAPKEADKPGEADSGKLVTGLGNITKRDAPKARSLLLTTK